jgi:peptide/nickel transport system substrate-binding protein
VAITTKVAESNFPYSMSYIPMISPCKAETLKYDWNAYANDPSGTGPYRFSSMVPQERLELLPNKDYWNPERVPKLDKLVLPPMPKSAARAAAMNEGTQGHALWAALDVRPEDEIPVQRVPAGRARSAGSLARPRI